MTDHTLRIGILGMTGRMGKSFLLQAVQDPLLTVIGGSSLHSTDQEIKTLLTPFLDKLPPKLLLEKKELFTKADLLIDFSHAQATKEHLEYALSYSKPLIIGCTGQTQEDHEAIHKASTHIPLFLAANFSIGMALWTKFSVEMAKCLKNGYLDIIETHHIHKKDAPSGSALALAHSLSKEGFIPTTTPSSPRLPTEVVLHSLRTSNVIGEHTASLRLEEEELHFTHKALSRQVFAKGAIAAVKFLIHKPPGLYSMLDLIQYLAQDTSFKT